MNRSRIARLILFALALATAVPAAAEQDKAPERRIGLDSQSTGGEQARHGRCCESDCGGRWRAHAGSRGSAVDAAIAVQLVLNLVEPQSSGIGGGSFMLFHSGKSGLVTAYDGRETAPAAAKADRFLDAAGRPLASHDAVVGGRSVGVPGVLRMLQLAHQQYGKLPWAQLFEPAIAVAENGFAVSPRLAAAIAAEPYLRQERARAYFFNRDGTPVAAGQTLRNPAFATTLRKIAAGGADAFYKGEIARDIVETVDRSTVNPGDMTELDLALQGEGTRTRVRALSHHRVCGMPLPSSGGMTVLQILGLLEPST
jgi:gamma-glutamyltranspeptidase/glutathione hydrolase